MKNEATEGSSEAYDNLVSNLQAAADRGEVVPLEDVKKMIPKWASK
jgi:predicted transcriptional regulator